MEHSSDVRSCMGVVSPRPRRILVSRGRPLDAEKEKPVPVGAGDGVGNGGEGLVGPSLPLESLCERCDGVGSILPLPDHLRARLDAAAAWYGIRVAVANGVGDFPQPTFCCNR